MPDAPTPRVYLAGPDVFHPDRLSLAAQKKAICADVGLVGVFPLDEMVAQDADLRAYGLAIAAKDFRLARSCAAALVNLTPYHGPSMDVGTAVELGFLRALGRPMIGYTNAAGDFASRAAPVAREGWSVERFGLTDNLMVDGALEAVGGRVIRPETDQPFEDLATFRAAAEALSQML